jgi:hypothetical protein
LDFVATGQTAALTSYAPPLGPFGLSSDSDLHFAPVHTIAANAHKA